MVNKKDNFCRKEDKKKICAYSNKNEHKRISLKEIDESIKKTRQNAERIEREMLELHKKITFLI